MSKLTDLTIAGARAGLDAGAFSARELAEAHIEAYTLPSLTRGSPWEPSA